MDAPNAGEIEVSLFGPGYGETIVVHYGNGKWIIIDSCVDSSKKPVALSYLKDLNVDYKNAVKLIVITHWHDDHVRGIHNIVRECPQAIVSFSHAITSREFLKLASLYSKNPMVVGSGPQEFINVIDTLKNKMERFKPSSQDTLLLKDSIALDTTPIDIECWSLSPSGNAYSNSLAKLGELYNSAKTNKMRLSSISPNHLAVVVKLKIGSEEMLFGSDMECDKTDNSEWNLLLRNSIASKGTSSVYKVAHHGAESGENEKVWTQLLMQNPISILTPFTNGGVKLPYDSDKQRLKTKSNSVYITADNKSKKILCKSNTVQKMFNSVVKKSTQVNNVFGHIRLRKKIDSNEAFKVDLFGEAYRL